MVLVRVTVLATADVLALNLVVMPPKDNFFNHDITFLLCTLTCLCLKLLVRLTVKCRPIYVHESSQAFSSLLFTYHQMLTLA